MCNLTKYFYLFFILTNNLILKKYKKMKNYATANTLLLPRNITVKSLNTRVKRVTIERIRILEKIYLNF